MLDIGAPDPARAPLEGQAVASAAPPYGPPPGYPAPPYGAPYGAAYAQPYPQVYAQPYAYPYPPFGFALAAPPDGKTVKPTLAAIFWAFVLVRDLFFVVIVSIFWMESANFGFVPNFPFGIVDDPLLLLSFTLLGVGASAMAMILDLVRAKHLYATAAGLLSTAACVTPGILFGFGVVGVSLSAIALAFHLLSGQEFARFEERARAARGLPAR